MEKLHQYLGEKAAGDHVFVEELLQRIDVLHSDISQGAVSNSILQFDNIVDWVERWVSENSDARPSEKEVPPNQRTALTVSAITKSFSEEIFHDTFERATGDRSLCVPRTYYTHESMEGWQR